MYFLYIYLSPEQTEDEKIQLLKDRCRGYVLLSAVIP